MLGEGGRKLGGEGKESTRGRIFLGGGRYEQIFGWWGGGGDSPPIPPSKEKHVKPVYSNAVYITVPTRMPMSQIGYLYVEYFTQWCKFQSDGSICFF